MSFAVYGSRLSRMINVRCWHRAAISSDKSFGPLRLPGRSGRQPDFANRQTRQASPNRKNCVSGLPAGV